MKKIMLLAFILSVSLSQVFAEGIDPNFFTKTDALLSKHVKNGLADYGALKNNTTLSELITEVGSADFNGVSASERKAFLINAYNLLVLDAAAKEYPLNSVLKVSGFFDGKKHLVAGEKITLNKLEKDWLIKETGDARLHFVLVCGAISCPVITPFAYQPTKLDQQMEMQTKMALNDPNFLKVKGSEVQLSKIFEWYTNDFGGNNKSKIDFINKYRANKLPADAKVSYYEYDWSLNDISAQGGRSSGIGNEGQDGSSFSNTGAANASRYVVSAAIPQGQTELKLFNNLYSQKSGPGDGQLLDRSTFFTTTLSALYGFTGRFNGGLEVRYRRVQNTALPSSAFSVLGGLEEGSGRTGITALGPKVRFAPVKDWKNFSVQTTLTFPIGQDLAGNATQPYIDWNGASFYNQFFNDFSIGTNFSLFTEIDFIWEDIGSASSGSNNQISTPVTLIGSYFPNPKTTLYLLGQYSPFYAQPFNYFVQGGVGAKYQFTSYLELELITTLFSNRFLSEVGGNANTFSLGFRYNIL